MVQIYAEPLCRRHHARLLSAAVLFRALGLAAAVVLSIAVAAACGGFWPTLAHAAAGPTAHLTGDAVLVLEGGAAGQEQVWTTSPALRGALGGGGAQLAATVQAGEEDADGDGRPELLRFVARARPAAPVRSAKLLLQVSYELRAGPAAVRLHGLVYAAAASPLAGAGVTVNGELQLHQAGPLPAGVVVAALGRPLGQAGDGRAAAPDRAAVAGDAALSLEGLLAAHAARNVSTRLGDAHSVWRAGSGDEFVVDVTVRVPQAQVVAYRPGPAEMLKWGWVQFACTMWALLWALRWLERVVFGLRVVETRVLSDVQPRTQRF